MSLPGHITIAWPCHHTSNTQPPWARGETHALGPWQLGNGRNLSPAGSGQGHWGVLKEGRGTWQVTGVPHAICSID